MITKPNELVTSTDAGFGLTKLEYFANSKMDAIISKIPLQDSEGTLGAKTTKEKNWELYCEVAHSAVRYAEALIDELNRKEPSKE